MSSQDPRIDAYIHDAADFARPILQHLRKLVHKACPDVEETMKWQFPHYEYKGILCSMAAFKGHCAFGFWKASLLKDDKNILHLTDKAAMGSLGRISSMEDLPSDQVLISYIKEAVKLNEEGVKVASKERSAGKKELAVPEELTAALQRNKKAHLHFEQFSPSQKKEYIEWILDAKSDATREKRLDTAIEWIAEGKTRHWKYKR